MSRTHIKHARVYIDGYDWSGDTRKLGTLGATWDAPLDASFSDEVKNTVLGKTAEIIAGPINAFMSPGADASGFHDAFSVIAERNVMIALGVGAAPIAGDPVFAWQFAQQRYTEDTGESFQVVEMEIRPKSTGVLSYGQPWGSLLHAKAVRTAVNSAAGIDDNGDSSDYGGIFVYQLFTSNGTVTLKAQEADTNSDGSFGDLSGATSGSIDASAAPKSGMVALGSTAAVKRYLRWQLAFGTADTATFALAFIRGQFPS